MLHRDVEDEALDVQRLSLLSADDPFVVPNPDDPAVGGDDPEIHRQAPVCAFERGAAGGQHALAILGVQHLREERILEPRLTRIPEDVDDPRADVRGSARRLRPRRVDGQRQLLDQTPILLLRDAERLEGSGELSLRLFLLSDVDHAALDELGLPVVVAHGPRLVVNPDRSTVGGDHPVLADPDALVLGQRQVVLREDPLAVVGVENGAVEVGIGPALERIPEDGDRPFAHVLRAVLVALRRSIHRDGDRLDQLAVPALRLTLLPLELGVPDRRSHIDRDRSEETSIGVVESIVGPQRLHAEHTDRLITREDRHAEVRPDARADAALTDRAEIGLAVEQHRLPATQHRRCRPVAERQRRPRHPGSFLAEERERDRLRFRVEQRDVGDIGGERVLEQVAREIDQRVHLQLCGQRLADPAHRLELALAPN